MPIRPENRARYPKDWKAISLRIRRERAEDRRQHLSSARKAASAMIAKIPLALSSHIARVYRPDLTAEAA